MSYTPDMLRGTRSRDGLLWHWGVAAREGHFPAHRPADPDRPRLAVTHDSRPPCPEEYLDLSIAFAALHPATTGLGNAGTLAWLPHAPEVHRHQLAIYRYYVAGDGYRDRRAAFARLSPERRQLYLDHLEALRRQYPGEPDIDDADGDALVALHIPRERGGGHISRQYANDLRNDAIRRMVAFLNRRPRTGQIASAA